MTTAPHVSYDTSGPSVTREELEAFAGGLLQAVGMDLEDADFTARTLVHADLRGVHSHGVRMLPLYVRTLSSGSMNPSRRWKPLCRRAIYLKAVVKTFHRFWQPTQRRCVESLV